jgi:glycosyltransferase involved in cell wall biosynthesis
MSFLNSSNKVTVLGEKQKDKLVQLGLSREKILVVPNSCNMAIVPNQFIDKKHNDIISPINLLHLSLLIESKGFMIYLEALELLSRKKLNQPLKAILCGPITFSPFCHRFKNADDKKAWIERKVGLINRISDGRVTVEWIPGAGGLQKQKLFEDAHIFVFPSYFPVEAQPIVLLEALATGSAIITSTVGEIPSTLNHDCAVFIEKPEPQIIADEIYKLIINPEKRIEMAINGLELIKGPLSLDSHISTWHTIFDEIQN